MICKRCQAGSDGVGRWCPACAEEMQRQLDEEFRQVEEAMSAPGKPMVCIYCGQPIPSDDWLLPEAWSADGRILYELPWVLPKDDQPGHYEHEGDRGLAICMKCVEQHLQCENHGLVLRPGEPPPPILTPRSET